jgi:Domain of unknown function (DUF4279)
MSLRVRNSRASRGGSLRIELNIPSYRVEQEKKAKQETPAPNSPKLHQKQCRIASLSMVENCEDDRVSARIIIESRTLTPEEISSRLGIPWDEATRIGEPRGHAGKLWEVHTWTLSVQKHGSNLGLSAHALLPHCIEELLHRIEPIADALSGIVTSEGGQLAIWVTSSSVPGITLDQHTIRTVADLGLSLDVDIVLINNA